MFIICLNSTVESTLFQVLYNDFFFFFFFFFLIFIPKITCELEVLKEVFHDFMLFFF